MIFRQDGNTLTCHGRIWEGDGMEFVGIFTEMEKAKQPITIRLHTIGGSVFDGNLMYNTLRDSKADVRIEIIGIAASMGAILALSRPKVYMAENGFLMIHPPSGTTQGTAEEHIASANLLTSISEVFIKNLMGRTGKDANYVKKWLVGDNWFNAEAALTEGLIADTIESQAELLESITPTNMSGTEVYNQFTAALELKNELQTKLNPMKQQIINDLGLPNVTAESSDTAVIEAVKAHYEQKEKEMQAKLDQASKAKDKLEKLEAKIKEDEQNRITAVLDAAQKTGKITAAQVSTYKSIAENSGVEALETVLESIPVRKGIAGEFGATGGQGSYRADWDFDKWQKEDPRGLEAMQKEDPEGFKALLKTKFK